MPNLTIFERPDWNDVATRCGTWWTKKLLDQCPTPVLELHAENAVRLANEAAIKANPDAFYYGFGHGNSSQFAGQNNAIVIDNQNVALWDKAWVHLLSCSVFASLGLKFPHGSGYNRTFYFYISDQVDGYAEPYYDSDHTVMKNRWPGKTMSEQIKAAKDRFTWWYSQPGPAGKDYLPWDRDSLIGTGDPNDRPAPVKGIVKVDAYYRTGDSTPTLIGAMTKGDADAWTLTWRIPQSGTYKIQYVATDHEGNTRTVETGEFYVDLPESPIEIIPVYPKGGEHITTRSVVLGIIARYVE